MPILNAGESHRTVQRLDVYMRVTYVAHINYGSGAFYTHIALQLFCAQRTGCGTQSDAGIRGHLNFVIHFCCFWSCAGKKVRKNVHTVAALVPINFYLVRTEEYSHHHYIARARFY